MPVNRDDRILPATRVVSVIVVLILVPALIVLWGLPDRTDDLWAWTIKGQMTPVFMGSVYGAGAYFFTRAALESQWHRVSAGVLSGPGSSRRSPAACSAV